MKETNSLVEAAYAILQDSYDAGNTTPMSFMEICEKICYHLGISEEEMAKKASRLYTSLTLDGRFVLQGNNTWFLKEHVAYKDWHLDMKVLYSEEESENEEENKNKKADEDSEEESLDSEEALDNYDSNDRTEDEFEENDEEEDE